MQVLITHGRMARARAMQFSALQLALLGLGLAIALLLLSGAIYHFVFLKAAREGWPVVSQVVKWVVRDEIAERDRIMRENLDAMARRVGEMQARLVQLEAIGERVSGLAGVKTEELAPLRRSPPAVAAGGRGGPFVAAAPRPSLEELQRALAGLGEAVDRQGDLFIFSESRLVQNRLDALLQPTAMPLDGTIGSGFGFRADPFSARAALHTGLDFPAEPGTPIMASAGGVVVFAGWHDEYGNLVEIDHGKGLITRYAHGRKLHVQAGDLVKRGQQVSEVGTTGRSTGPHLHFEVLVQGVPQDPVRFLAGSLQLARTAPRR
jgi:murein DD-endopeptidase MepM/ murein hydrolase activator NlpD